MQSYTTIEQSKKLMELGIDPLTSDMHYSFDGEHIRAAKDEDFSVSFGLALAVKRNLFSYRGGYIIPCWSLVALLELMPKENENPFKDSNAFIGYSDGQYRCVYLNGDWESSHQTLGDTPIKAAYNMVCWLLETGYIKKGENDEV